MTPTGATNPNQVEEGAATLQWRSKCFVAQDAAVQQLEPFQRPEGFNRCQDGTCIILDCWAYSGFFTATGRGMARPYA